MRVLIGFSTSSWWVSRLIRWATRAPVSHTYIVFDSIPEVDHELYEAAWCGFRLSTRQKLVAPNNTQIVREVEVPLDPARALETCRTWLQTPYDYRGLLGEAWVQIGLLFGRRWRNPFSSPHHMFCSEAATLLLQTTPVTRFTCLNDAIYMLDARKTDPYMLEKALSVVGS